MLRKFFIRAVSGLVFVAAMVSGLMINKFLFAALMLFLIAGMMSEFYGITMRKRYRFSRFLAIMAGEVLFLLLFFSRGFGMPVRYVSLSFIPILAIMINSIYQPDRNNFSEFSHIYTGMLYIAVPLAFSNFLVFRNNVFSGKLLLCFFIIIWASDVGAYVLGIIFGKRIWPKKLFPSISPHKSWAGFFGGLLSAVISSVALTWLGLFEFRIFEAVALAVLMHVSGVYGDLFESQWKRHYEVKDSGSIIPGHGGLLDRFDSALLAVPVGAIFLMIFKLFTYAA